ncbi:hypothetical protein K1T71_003478 [Dendrolimus kikuchii]|uniref:Uncharacterized protein n=1 Tax=Dendrolimus kikuchii TaxID=765133 RepID=A0ACC1DCQ3_9NEOP|nr:hypothetical protein K1T71_003478 [Dendrolimus kikuchii]
MAVKQCCIESCKSSTTRQEDIGVTYHKFPKDITLYNTWITVTHYRHNTELPAFVCSRHFCKTDFQIYKDSKYILKSDAVPSIFPWLTEHKMASINKMNNMNSEEKTVDDLNNVSTSSKESEPESVDIIQKFIKDQERLIQEQNLEKFEMKDNQNNNNVKETTERKNEDVCKEKNESSMCSPSILDMMMNTETKELKKNHISVNQSMSSIDKGSSSVALSIGSKVEAKDYSGDWHAAEIVEVDYDEMEVLVHYATELKRHDEWISVSSPRLRPITSTPKVLQTKPSTSQQQLTTQPVPRPSSVIVKEEPKEIKQEPKEIKLEEKVKLTFEVGERCLARWRDNKRFMATINNKLENGSYEIVFDDGFYWKCSISRLYKWKPNKATGLTIDTVAQSPSTSSLSPVQYGAGPGNTPLTTPVFHTHLFDPTRDYLGSKSERREMKRKLNIKEIFNIGQKKPKTQKNVDKEPKKEIEKNVRVIKRVPKVKLDHAKVVLQTVKPKIEVKTELPDAVASIIGTVTKDEPTLNNEEIVVKKEIIYDKLIPMEVEVSKEYLAKGEEEIKLKQEESDITSEDIYDIDGSPDNTENKSDIDPILEEETALEKFEQPDELKHEQVIDRMKEVINKLENNINEIEKANSPKPAVTEAIEKLQEDVQEEIQEGVQEGVQEEIQEEIQAEIQEEIQEEIQKQIKEKVVEEPQEEIATNEVQIKDSPPEQNQPEVVEPEIENVEVVVVNPDKPKKLSKIKKSKKMRLLQERKVKKQVEKVKSELEEMKRQVEEMRQQMLAKTEELANRQPQEMPESYLLPGEWCCKWVNKQPVGTVSEIESDIKVDGNNKPILPRRSVQVEDKRLPPGWTKHMVRRSFGNSAGKWDVVLVNPENRRFHTKMDMRNYLENNPDESLRQYEYALLDFGVHLKLSRRMGWMRFTPGGEAEAPEILRPELTSASPLVKRKGLDLKRKVKGKEKRFKMKIKRPRPTQLHTRLPPNVGAIEENQSEGILPSCADAVSEMDYPPLEDGFVYVGSLKVQIIDNLLRCPAEGCFKNFRNNTLIQMHIKHYHRELRKMLGATPKVADLAYARTMPTDIEPVKSNADQRIIKVKITKPKREEPKENKESKESKEMKPELQVVIPQLPMSPKQETEVRPQDSPKLRLALNKPAKAPSGPRPPKRPKVLLPVRRPDPEPQEPAHEEFEPSPFKEIEMPMEALDFETAISTHTVTKPVLETKKKEKRTSYSHIPPKQSEDEDWFGNSDVETRSSYARSGTPDSKTMDLKIQQPVSSESNEEQKDGNMYMYTENGERIKIVHMKREEIINCHCGFREEDGLMVQCELCLCWQHALCHNIQREADVPEKYTCSICLNPRRGRRSRRFLHDQDRLYEGLLPAARACDSLRRSHELTGNLLRIDDALHALTLKYYVATKKDHPKLYLWAKDWEHAEIAYTQEKLNSDYTDLNIMISNIGKENLPVKADIKDMQLDIRTPSEDHDSDRFIPRDSHLGSQTLLSGLLSSPEGPSLELPISTSELERLAKSVQEQEAQLGCAAAPQPEAAIESGECRARLLRHIQRCQALIDARLDSIEAQVAELESQDPSFEDDETPDFFPRTKRTVQMLMRDLDTMEELGIIT